MLIFQVVTLALYTYFIAALLGRQFVPDATGPVGKFEEPDMYFPFFTALQVNFVLKKLTFAVLGSEIVLLLT